jgi:hypothetical protein
MLILEVHCPDRPRVRFPTGSWAPISEGQGQIRMKGCSFQSSAQKVRFNTFVARPSWPWLTRAGRPCHVEGHQGRCPCLVVGHSTMALGMGIQLAMQNSALTIISRWRESSFAGPNADVGGRRKAEALETNPIKLTIFLSITYGKERRNKTQR